MCIPGPEQVGIVQDSARALVMGKLNATISLSRVYDVSEPGFPEGSVHLSNQDSPL